MKPSTEQDYRERIVRSLVYIQEHLDDPLELDRLADVAGFSRFHFHRVFRGLVGEALKEYIRRLRLERAARNLKRLDEPVTQIALDAGFDTHEAFTRAFGAMFGVSPTAYRKAHRPPPESASGAHFENLAGYHPPEYGPALGVEVREFAPMQVVFLRHVGPYDQVGTAWGRLMAWAGMRGLLGPGMRLIGIVHDDPDVTPPDKLRYDAAASVSRPFQPEGDVGTMDIAGGSYAVAMIQGPYHTLPAAYQQMYGAWLPHSGYELRDEPAFEQYLNSPQTTRSEDLRTLICVPVG